MSKFVQPRFLISVLVFVSRDFELGRKLRCDTPVWLAGVVDHLSCRRL